jgi:hypothetical protein
MGASEHVVAVTGERPAPKFTNSKFEGLPAMMRNHDEVHCDSYG